MKRLFIVLLVIAVFGISIVSCSREAESIEKVIDISEVEKGKIGEEVAAGDIIWKITEARNLGYEITSEGSYILQSGEGSFINIDFEVLNNGSEPRQILDLKLIDDKGRTFKICIEAYGVLGPYTNDACTLATILPGERRSFNTTFDINDDFEQIVLEVNDLKLPSEYTKYIELNL